MNDDKHLPMWEVCIRAWGPEHKPEPEYEHYHPRAETEEGAIEKAEDTATGIGLKAIVGSRDTHEIVEVSGPYTDDVVERTASEKRAERVPEEQASLEEVA